MEIQSINDSTFDIRSITNLVLKELSDGITKNVLNGVSNLLEEWKPTLDEKDELLTIKETCKLVKKSRTALHNWRDAGLLLPVAKSGNSPFYSKKQVEEFLTNNIKENYYD